MILFLDIDSRALLDSKQAPFRRLDLKRRDTDIIELQFLRNNIVQELPTGTTIRLGIKADGAYAGSFLATATTFAKSGTGTSTKYLADLNLNTTDLNTAFSSATPPEPDSLPAMLEVEWTSGTNVTSSKTLPVTIANDVIRGNEGTPATLPLFYTSSTSNFLSTQAEAEAGADNTKWMSPLRVFQAISSWISNNFPQILPSPIVIKNVGDELTARPDSISSTYNNTIINFEESYFAANGQIVFEWDDPSDPYLSLANRRIVQLGAPINNDDAVRLTDLNDFAPQLRRLTFAGDGGASTYSAQPGRNVRMHINSENLTADPSVILKRQNEGAKFGDILRIEWSRTGHTRSLLVRHYPSGGTTLATLATLSNPGVYGFAFDGTNWVTEASFTGL